MEMGCIKTFDSVKYFLHTSVLCCVHVFQKSDKIDESAWYFASEKTNINRQQDKKCDESEE